MACRAVGSILAVKSLTRGCQCFAGFDRGYAPEGRSATEGTAARPGTRTNVPTNDDSKKQIDDLLNNLPEDVAVRPSLLLNVPWSQKNSCSDL